MKAIAGKVQSRKFEMAGRGLELHAQSPTREIEGPNPQPVRRSTVSIARYAQPIGTRRAVLLFRKRLPVCVPTSCGSPPRLREEEDPKTRANRIRQYPLQNKLRVLRPSHQRFRLVQRHLFLLE